MLASTLSDESEWFSCSSKSDVLHWHLSHSGPAQSILQLPSRLARFLFHSMAGDLISRAPPTPSPAAPPVRRPRNPTPPSSAAVSFPLFAQRYWLGTSPVAVSFQPHPSAPPSLPIGFTVRRIITTMRDSDHSSTRRLGGVATLHGGLRLRRTAGVLLTYPA